MAESLIAYFANFADRSMFRLFRAEFRASDATSVSRIEFEPPVYSARIATVGSMRNARRAGK